MKNTSFEPGNLDIRWFEDGTLNVAANCLDRHLETRGDQTAILWEGDDPKDSRAITYRELHEEVCRMANVLKERGVKKGDRVTIYMPMIPEAAYAMLACARIGAVHSVVFGGFSPDALAGRLDGRRLLGADHRRRGPARRQESAAEEERRPGLRDRRQGRPEGRDRARRPAHRRRRRLDRGPRRLVARGARRASRPTARPAEMQAEDPLFILYTSGSTGKPKGVLHTSGGYLVYASMTHEYVFDYHEGDVYWCTADVGWVTGHSYIVYGPLANGATTLMFEGVPNYPDAAASGRWSTSTRSTSSTPRRRRSAR